ncbi:MAG: TaqI-like C-terminal specificity domain-containing protein, partial [Candidatus Levybacteria bacterium]|nr:TaqI-like C-terminal specificity domain-containing protein [Candidatus Levybacteria bacterium]
NGNSLISGSDPELEKCFGKNYRDKKPFNWQVEFPEVFKQGGFDVIIGNPPYLKELDNKELFREIKNSNFGKYYQGKMDFWYFFLHRSIEILKDKGIMGFITNSYFLKSAGATKLIDHLQKEMVLIKAVDFQDIKVFEDVSGRHLIHIWEKIKNKDSAITKFIKLDKDSFNGTIDDNKYKEIPYIEVIKNSQINFETNNQTTNKNTLPLGNLFDVSQGVVEATDKVSKKLSANGFKSGDGVFVLSEQELQELNLDQKEKTIIKKYLNTNNIQKYYINFNNEYLVYSDKDAKNKIAAGEYSHIKSHLDKMEQFITSSNGPYGLHRPRENRYFENPKLICKGMFLSPEFCFDDEKYYVGFSFSVIIPKDKDYDLKYLLGLLNSSFGKNWFNTNGKKRGIGVDIGVAVFRNFPVYTADKEQQKGIIVLIDKMLELNKELHKMSEHSDKWESIKSEIEKTDKNINEEVYKLYGLTLEEIGIVEAKK